MSELTPVTMPKWGLMMEEGTVTAWLAREGDRLEPGAEIVEIETSKITNVMETPAPGALLRIVCEEGRTVPVGQLLAVLGPGDADPAAVAAFVDGFEPVVPDDEDETAAGPALLSVEVNGGTVAAVELGAGDPPLVLIHGFGGDRNNWLFNLDGWARGHRVISLDLPGHGASSKSFAAWDLPSLAAAVLAAMDQLDVGRAVLVGHSLGAGVALQLALDYPQRVAGLVAIAGLGFGGEVSGEFVERFLQAERRKELAGAVEMLFADPNLASRDMVDQLLAFKRTDGVQSALEAIAAATLKPDLAAALSGRISELRAPALAIHGTADRVIAPSMGSLQGVEQRRLEGVGHMPHMEAAAAVTDAVTEFSGRVA